MRPPVKRFFIFWFPVIVYCAIIFTLSSFSRPLPEDLTILRLDKLLHAVEYGILCALLLRALRNYELGLSGRNVIILAVVLSVLYGVSDEIHQFFVPGRSCSVFDLLADFVGAAIAGVIKR